MLPYIPTTALVNSTTANTIYVFEPSDDETSASLIALDSSRALTSNFAATTVSSSLPFLSNNSTSAFSPFIDEAGNVYVLSGECAKGANGTSLWTLKTGQDLSKAEWTKAELSTSGFDDTLTVGAVNYLAGGYAFSGSKNDTPTLYSFGGMCPNSSATTNSASTWQSAANYSQALLSAAPSGVLSSSSFASVSSNQDTFDLSQSPARGPPVSEAGFSVTPLPPSYSDSNKSTAQQNLVFIGGHTAQAFINMSQVALLSLPEQSWSFLPIKAPGEKSAELVRRDSSAVEPRSGHSAVLSEDGTKVIVFGGWVGDINTAATPQLVVLSVGSGYGGSGAWQWSVPSYQGSAPSGDGVYGHGAVMLPGNVMMIVGGNTISAKSSKLKRVSSPASFFNISSNTWISEYKNPLAQSSGESSSPSAFTDHRGRTLGLGLGLGLGIPLFLLALCLLYCCVRRSHHRRKNLRQYLEGDTASRANERDLMSRDSAYDPGQTAMMERHGEQYPYPWAPGSAGGPGPEGQDGGWRGMRSVEAERTGLLVDIPSPTRGLRKGVQARQTAYYDEARSGRRSGIHVIEEGEEAEAYDDGDLGTAQHDSNAQRAPTYKLPEIKSSAPLMDPFVDPLGAHPVSFSGSVSPVTPSPNEDPEREDKGWIEDWESLNTRLNTQSNGHHEAGATSPLRLSPDRASPESGHARTRRNSPNHSDRTISTLSEKSMHSAVSYVSNVSRQSGTSLKQNPSQRSTNLFSVRQRSQKTPPVRRSLPSTGTVAAAVATLQGTPSSSTRSPGGADHSRNQSNDSATGSPSMRLPSFGTLQAESQALLGRSAATPATHLGHTTNIEPTGTTYVDADEDDEFPRRPNQRRSRGILGGVRTALSRGRGRASSSSPTNQFGSSPTTATFPGSSPSRSGTGTPFSLLRSVASEHDAAGHNVPAVPEAAQASGHKRTGSSGSNLWNKRNSGARDWDWRQDVLTSNTGEAEARRSGSEKSKQRHSSSSPDNGTITASLRDDASGEWDIEGAIETRQVQVMFTVPRERLRVVNAGESEVDAESILTRQESERDVGKGKGRADDQIRHSDDLDGNDKRGDHTGSRWKPGRGSPGLW